MLTSNTQRTQIRTLTQAHTNTHSYTSTRKSIHIHVYTLFVLYVANVRAFMRRKDNIRYVDASMSYWHRIYGLRGRAERSACRTHVAYFEHAHDGQAHAADVHHHFGFNQNESKWWENEIFLIMRAFVEKEEVRSSNAHVHACVFAYVLWKRELSYVYYTCQPWVHFIGSA